MRSVHHCSVCNRRLHSEGAACPDHPRAEVYTIQHDSSARMPTITVSIAMFAPPDEAIDPSQLEALRAIADGSPWGIRRGTALQASLTLLRLWRARLIDPIDLGSPRGFELTAVGRAMLAALNARPLEAGA